MDREKYMVKALNVRLPKDVWLFLKHFSADRELSMNEIIVMCLKKLKMRHARSLTDIEELV